MKKLFLLLILSFFSAQSFAGSCPDGSEPIKSISADGTYFVYNCGGDSNNAKDTKESEAESPSSKSIYVSDKDYNDFLNLPRENKIQSCGYERFKPNWQVINKDLPPRIKGFNSRMDNGVYGSNAVEGGYYELVRSRYLEAITFAMVSEDLELKEKLFDKLYDWASEDVLSATMRCYFSSGPLDIAPACEGEWSDPDGKDLAPIKDATHMLEVVMSLNYVYKLYFADYQPDDKRHKVITGWFESFYNRIKSAKDFYFGNYVGWYLPNISIKHSQNKSYKSMVKKMVKGLDEWTFADGSMKNLTTRGNRALWYHHRGIGEAFIIMEVARTANVEIPDTLEKKLLKAVELFHDAYLDHSVIEPWAKEAHNSQASNGHQEDMPDLVDVSTLSAWFNIFQLRYPEHRTAKWLNQELTSNSNSLKIAENTGVTLGCIHQALADSSPEGLAKQEAKRISADLEQAKKISVDLEQAKQISVDLEQAKQISADLELPIFDDVEYKLEGQILKINIFGPKMKPLIRHLASLQRKCGSGLITGKRWDWLSFVSSDSDNIRNSNNQQCHYDYYKSSNDNEAFELFQAVLSGTDSIFDYLETNVEP
jgi:hypothetical protein